MANVMLMWSDILLRIKTVKVIKLSHKKIKNSGIIFMIIIIYFYNNNNSSAWEATSLFSQYRNDFP